MTKKQMRGLKKSEQILGKQFLGMGGAGNWLRTVFNNCMALSGIKTLGYTIMRLEETFSMKGLTVTVVL
jgi:hypothetical protein